MYFEATCPGSIMLWGEHLVLHGAHAIVGAINQFVTVRLSPRDDNLVVINDDYQAMLPDLPPHPNYAYVLGAINSYRHLYRHGFNLVISSNILPNVGFASSAAVTVACIKVIAQFLQLQLSAISLLQQARSVVKMLKQVGSGADLAAAIWGGVILYQQQEALLEHLPAPPIEIIYSGYKTETAQVINYVNHKMPPRLWPKMVAFSEKLLPELIGHWLKLDWRVVGELFNIYHGLLDALGVVTLDLHHIANHLRSHDTIYGAKVSGSGLGDSVIGLGQVINKDENFRYITTPFSTPT